MISSVSDDQKRVGSGLTRSDFLFNAVACWDAIYRSAVGEGDIDGKGFGT